MVAKFVTNASHRVNFWVRCASGNVLKEVFPYTYIDRKFDILDHFVRLPGGLAVYIFGNW